MNYLQMCIESWFFFEVQQTYLTSGTSNFRKFVSLLSYKRYNAPVYRMDHILKKIIKK